MVKVVNVAVGVVEKQGKVLLAFRDASKHQGNRYEFAGGKVEEGETPLMALKRELQEELAIDVKQAVRLMQITHDYGDKQVVLHVFLIKQFVVKQPLGELGDTGNEGQALIWVDAKQLHQYPLPEANKKIVEFLQHGYLSHRCCISYPLAAFTTPEHWLAHHIEQLPLQALCYIRPQANDLTNIKVIQQLLEQRKDIQAIVNIDYFTQLSTSKYTIRAWHLNQNQLLQLQPTSHQLMVGQVYIASCHDSKSVAKANQMAAYLNAILLSPICTTQTHPLAIPLGWQGFSQLAHQSCLPVYALGGLMPADIAQVWQQGGYGVAGIRHFVSDNFVLSRFV